MELYVRRHLFHRMCWYEGVFFWVRFCRPVSLSKYNLSLEGLKQAEKNLDVGIFVTERPARPTERNKRCLPTRTAPEMVKLVAALVQGRRNT